MDKVGLERNMGGSSSLREPAALSPEQIASVRSHLATIVTSHAFSGSRRTQDFLRLIVNHALEGKVESLRERMIGAELFGRPVGYDTGNDSVVRVRASEVRKKLTQFYKDAEAGRHSIRIELPSGSYVPRFYFELPVESEPAAGSEGEQPPQDEVPVPPDSEPAPPSGAADPPRRRSSPRAAAAAGLALLVILCGLGVLGGAYAGWRWWRTARAPRPHPIRSIAVLPLRNLSGDPGEDPTADALTAALIRDLGRDPGRIPALRVRSLTSSMSLKGSGRPLPAIARELGVDGVVEGEVALEDGRMLISVRLIDAGADRPVWERTFARDRAPGSSWQGEVAEAIAAQIALAVEPGNRSGQAAIRPLSPAAREQYLRGVLLRDAGDCRHAIDAFGRTLALDAGYAPAHSALAGCYGSLGESGQMSGPQAFGRERSEAMRAIELDDSLGRAHAEVATAAMVLDWDWATARAEFHRALELDPGSAASHEEYAVYLVRSGDSREALREVQRAAALDPVSGRTFRTEGWIDYLSRRYDLALEMAQSVEGVTAAPAEWELLRGEIDLGRGDRPAAIRELRRAGEGAEALGHLGNAYGRSGETAEALDVIARLEEDVNENGVGRYELALVFAGMDRRQDALRWLGGAVRAHDAGVVNLGVDPCLDPLRSEPGFRDLAARVMKGAGPGAG